MLSSVPSRHAPCTSSSLRLLVRRGWGRSQTGHHHSPAFAPVTSTWGRALPPRSAAPPAPSAVSMRGRCSVRVCKDLGLPEKGQVLRGLGHSWGCGLPPEPSRGGEWGEPRNLGAEARSPLAPGPKQTGGRFRPQPLRGMKLLWCRRCREAPDTHLPKSRGQGRPPPP